MPIDVDAVYENGVIKPKQPRELPEKAEVHVTIATGAPGLSPPDVLSVAGADASWGHEAKGVESGWLYVP